MVSHSTTFPNLGPCIREWVGYPGMRDSCYVRNEPKKKQDGTSREIFVRVDNCNNLLLRDLLLVHFKFSLNVLINLLSILHNVKHTFRNTYLTNG